MQRSTCTRTHVHSGVRTLSQRERVRTGANALVRFGITALLIGFVFVIVIVMLIFVLVIFVVDLVPSDLAFASP